MFLEQVEPEIYNSNDWNDPKSIFQTPKSPQIGKIGSFLWIFNQCCMSWKQHSVEFIAQY